MYNIAEQDLSLRLHRVLADNHQLQDKVALLEEDLHRHKSDQSELKRQLKIVMDELNSNDQHIQRSRLQHDENTRGMHKLTRELEQSDAEGEQLKEEIIQIKHLNQSLESQNELLIRIKDSYAAEIFKLKAQLTLDEDLRQQHLRDSSILNEKVMALMEDTASLESELKRRRKIIEQATATIEIKTQEIDLFKQSLMEVNVQMERLRYKYKACKEKYLKCQEQRNWAIEQLQKVAHEINDSTMHKYWKCSNDH